MKLMDGQTTTGAGASLQNHGATRSFQAVLTGTGAVTATVVIEVSNDGDNFLTLDTLDLTGTDLATDGTTLGATWLYLRANVTAITGTGAAVSVFMGA